MGKSLPWMNGSLEDAVKSGILTPALNLRLKKEEEKVFDEGLVFEKLRFPNCVVLATNGICARDCKSKMKL